MKSGAERSRAYRERRKAQGYRILKGRPTLAPHRPMPEHGAISGYHYRRGCRCEPCRDGWNSYRRAYWRARRNADDDE